jgi:hypothetical protein
MTKVMEKDLEKAQELIVDWDMRLKINHDPTLPHYLLAKLEALIAQALSDRAEEVRREEREVCAKLAEEADGTPYSGDNLFHCGCGKRIAQDIRAMSKGE